MTLRTADRNNVGNINSSTKVIAATVMTTISSVYPTFLAGALGNTLKQELEIGDQFFGFMVGSFFAGAMLGSVTLSKVAEKIGGRLTILYGLSATIFVNLFIAVVARDGYSFIAALTVAGLANSANQPAVNKLISGEINKSQLGFAVAAKQSGMPTAALLGGLAVPGFALTIGWQWAYAAAALFAIFAWVLIWRVQAESSFTKKPPGTLRNRKSTLMFAAIGGTTAAAGSGALTNFLTSSAEDTGLSASKAGFLLSTAAFIGVLVRLISGIIADKKPNIKPVKVAGILLFIGGFGTIALGLRDPSVQTGAAIIAVGAGWSWPALFNFGVVKSNISAPSQATGITQTGVYLGVLSGPITMGYFVENHSYQTAWTVIAITMFIGSSIFYLASKRIDYE